MLVVVVVAALLLVSALPGLHTSPAFLPEDFQYDMEAAAPNQYEDGYLQGEAVMEEPTLVPASDDDDNHNHNHMMTVLLQLSAAELEGLLEVGEEELRENLQGDAVMEEPVPEPVMRIISYELSTNLPFF